MDQEFIIGVMITPIEDPENGFQQSVRKAAARMEAILADRLPNLKLEVFDFVGPHLTPAYGRYSPLELLQLGVIEKVERKPNFMLVVTEVGISSHLTTYSVALPSPLTNIGVISSKRLDPLFWNETADSDLLVQRLAGLMLHTTGRLLNLSRHPEPQNIMYRFEELADLEAMRQLTDHQVQQMAQALPAEARDRTAKKPARAFAVRSIFTNLRSIWRTVTRANPLRLATELPTFIAAAISLMVVIFFSTEIWDIGSTVELYQFIIFALLSIAIATFVVYRAHPLRTVATHTRRTSESLVVTNTAALLSLFLTLLVLFAAFWVLVYFGILTLFPRRLMETWPTVDPAVRTLDHIKISTFIAAMGTLVGSLGGRAENENLMRRILFVDVDF
ncbi:MAG: hypothetical protein GYB64_02755 [Chloroflexi bacterium]|nr:hypothetical protein [Chloroflexota bacterium]